MESKIMTTLFLCYDGLNILQEWQRDNIHFFWPVPIKFLNMDFFVQCGKISVLGNRVHKIYFQWSILL